MTKKLKARLLWLALALAAIAALYFTLQPASIVVEAAPVTRGPMQITVDEQGKTRARDRYIVAAPIAGRLMRPAIEEGDEVQQGEILARLAPAPEDPRAEAMLRAGLAAANARLSEAQARLSEAQSNARRAQSESTRRTELFNQGLVSAETRDLYAQTAQAARASLASSQASVAAAEADVDSARSQLLGASDTMLDKDMLVVRAPVTGTALRVLEESERVVSAGTPLFELSAGKALEVSIDLLTQDAVDAAPGQTVVISGWGGDTDVMGVLRSVNPGAFTKTSALGVEEQRVNVTADLAQVPPGLGIGYRVEAAIVTWTGEDVLRIPTAAIFRKDGAWLTYTIANGRITLRTIEIGRQGVSLAQVLGGVNAGEYVVLYPSDQVIDGARATAPNLPESTQ